MRVRVLGSAAGGGYPQWNCACYNCRSLREGTAAAQARTQECTALSVGDDWWLINVSPDIRQQLAGFPPLHPTRSRNWPVRGIFLTSANLDHTLGLLSLREGTPLAIFTTQAIRSNLTEGNVFFRALERFDGQVTWHDLVLGEEHLLPSRVEAPRLKVRALPAPGKPPLYREPGAAHDLGQNIAIEFRDVSTGGVLVYAPGVAYLTPELQKALSVAHCVFFDGTFWSSTELIDQGLGTRRAEDMAHLPISGPEGSMQLLDGIMAGQRVYTHMNNTNPTLIDDSPERLMVQDAGWKLAHDGLELGL